MLLMKTKRIEDSVLDLLLAPPPFLYPFFFSNTFPMFFSLRIIY